VKQAKVSFVCNNIEGESDIVAQQNLYCTFYCYMCFAQANGHDFLRSNDRHSTRVLLRKQNKVKFFFALTVHSFL